MHVKLLRREFIKGAGALGAAVAIDIRFIEKVPEKLLSVFSEETSLKCILVSNLGVMNAGKTTVSILLTRLMMQQGHTVNNFKIQGRINEIEYICSTVASSFTKFGSIPSLQSIIYLMLRRFRG